MQNKQGGRSQYSNTIRTTVCLLSTEVQLHGKPEHFPDSFPMGSSLRLQEEHFKQGLREGLSLAIRGSGVSVCL